VLDDQHRPEELLCNVVGGQREDAVTLLVEELLYLRFGHFDAAHRVTHLSS